MDAKEPHEVLGIAATAGIAEIRQAYRQMALKWHPDRHIHDDDKDYAIRMFGEVTNAYQVLIRNLDPPAGTAKAKLRARLPTPAPSFKSLTGSPSSTTSSSDSQLFTPFHSKDDSQSTLPSSFDGSVKARRLKTSNRDAQHYLPPISISNHQVSSSATDGSAIHEVNLNPKLTSLHSHPPLSWSTNDQSVPGIWNARDGKQKPLHPTRIPMPIRHLNVVGDPQFLKPAPPLHSLGVGLSGEWAYSLVLTLEELFSGKHCHFCVVRNFLSGRSKNVVIEIDIPSGCQRGARVLCRGVGHELPNGKLQDIAFVIEEAPHTWFSRVQDDLFLDIRLPWTDSLEQRPKKVCIRGIDGEDIGVFIDYSRDRMLKGNLSIRGAGMPIREGGRLCGRGNLVIQWEIQPPQTRVQRLLGRFLLPKTRRNFVAHYT